MVRGAAGPRVLLHRLKLDPIGRRRRHPVLGRLRRRCQGSTRWKHRTRPHGDPAKHTRMFRHHAFVLVGRLIALDVEIGVESVVDRGGCTGAWRCIWKPCRRLVGVGWLICNLDSQEGMAVLLGEGMSRSRCGRDRDWVAVELQVGPRALLRRKGGGVGGE